MRNILTFIFLSLLCAVAANAQSIKEFKTDLPGLIGTWNFEANPTGTSVPYQMALWVPDVTSYATGPGGVLTWYTCRTVIEISKLPRAQLTDYKITQDADILKSYDFFKIHDKGEFKAGYCTNRFGDQWPAYLLRHVDSGKYFIAGHLISKSRIQELIAMDKKNPYEANVSETSRRESGKAEFKIFSEIKRSRPDSNTAPALKYAEERLDLAEEIQHVSHILKDPATVYGAAFISQRKMEELKPYLPHQPQNIVTVASSHWSKGINDDIYTSIANGTYGGFGSEARTRFNYGYISLIRGYGHRCKKELGQWPTVSLNYEWVESDRFGEKNREQIFDERVFLRERYAESFDEAFRESRKVRLNSAMLNPETLAQLAFADAALHKKVFQNAVALIDDEGCNSPYLLQLLENYHRKLSNNSPYIQEVDRRIMELKEN